MTLKRLQAGEADSGDRVDVHADPDAARHSVAVPVDRSHGRSEHRAGAGGVGDGSACGTTYPGGLAEVGLIESGEVHSREVERPRGIEPGE